MGTTTAMQFADFHGAASFAARKLSQTLLRSALRKGLDPCTRAVTAAGSHMPARGLPAHDSCLSETGARINIAWTACAAITFACTACILRAKCAQSLMGLLGPKTGSNVMK